ncbi:MAG TPA: histidine kinase dimerization/phospho-acceptor domain-containing protein, partial [Gemmatimonadales bacterium]|nr:histidine kinase dimerization/phospho-acceptor domain-containing protein [Gemmatimonadales bacterium]
MSERADDPLLGTSSLLQTIPPAWREVIQGLRDTLVYAEEERDRLREALDRTTTEFRELLVELDALRQARVAAESTSIVRGEVVATVGRTMRTPADAILGLAGLLRSSSLLPTQRAYVDAVHGAAEALRSALNEVSDYSRLEGGTLPLEPIGFDLPLTARDLAAQLGVQAAAKGVGLRITCRPDAPPRLHGDPGRVRQIVAALVGDAISRVERGEIEVEVGPARVDIGGGGVTFV